RGMISIADFYRCRYARLDVERGWPEKGRLAGILPGVHDGGEEDLLGVRDLARARFEASEATPETVAREQLKAAREVMLARFQEFRAGRGTVRRLCGWGPAPAGHRAERRGGKGWRAPGPGEARGTGVRTRASQPAPP